MSGLYAYISGPMTGYPDLNRRAFADAASKIEQTRPYTLVIDPSEVSNPEWGWADYMRHHLRTIVTTKSLTVVTLPGWECSRGARLEVYVAHQLGIPVLPLDAYLTTDEGKP